MNTFVSKYIRTMLRHLLTYFEEYYHQDAVWLWCKTFIGMTVLNIPLFLPDAQGGAKFISVVAGCLSAILGLILMSFKVYDEIKKRLKK